MIPHARDSAKGIIRESHAFKTLCEYFRAELDKKQKSFHFYISPDYSAAKEEFCKLLLEQGYLYHSVNLTTIKITNPFTR